MYIEISPLRTLLVLLVTILFLVVASSLGVAWFIVNAPIREIPVWINLFNLNLEANIPTLFSSLQLLLAAVLLAGIAYGHRKQQESFLLWYVLATIFVFLAIDETAALHENLTVYVRTTLGTSGYFYYAWVIPYGIIAALVAGLFARFLIRLPRRSGLYFAGSGTLYLAGALGVEMLGGKYISSPGAEELTYTIIYTLEESLEMVGIAFFIYALLDYVTREFVQLNYSIRHGS
ncbi:hypothetical protein [Haliea salexigens]|uniref:hypothetical protein n=1 Tax=Haliea salexigens TaxID=287487 RepID=UPI0004040097|nr:hypothetical protein [Haliea salexigens]